MPHISIKAEKIFSVLGFPVTNSFLSSLIVTLLLIITAFYYQKQNKLPAKQRSSIYFLIQAVINVLYSFFASITGEKAEIFFPFLASFFLFIIINNWFGLVPGVGSILVGVTEYAVEHGKYVLHVRDVPLLRGTTADLNTTIALSIFSIFSIQLFGIKALGLKGYLHKFFDLKNPISLFTGVLEIFSEFSKIISFSFRLFGNIFAGEVLLVVIAFLIPVLASFPFLLLELFVGFIQALVFASLTAVFVDAATAKH